MIHARELTRSFTTKSGAVEAVAGIDLDVEEGELVAFLGPNGAGKTTTLRMLTTLLPPTSGTATVAGHDVVREPAAVRRRIGYIGQGNGAGHYHHVRDELVLQARAYGFGWREARRRAGELLAALQLEALAKRTAGTLSGGQRRRLDIAMGLVHAPPLLFLDEPSTGLDPQNRAHLWEHVLGVRERFGTTLFLTTHYLDEADTMAERVMIIDHGRVIADDTPAALKADLAGDRVVLRLSASDDGVGAAGVAGAAGAAGAAEAAGLAGFAGVAGVAGVAELAGVVREVAERLAPLHAFEVEVEDEGARPTPRSGTRTAATGSPAGSTAGRGDTPGPASVAAGTVATTADTVPTAAATAADAGNDAITGTTQGGLAEGRARSADVAGQVTGGTTQGGAVETTIAPAPSGVTAARGRTGGRPGVVVRLRLAGGAEVLPPLLRELDRRGVVVRSAEVARPTLDDVFLRLTGRSLREEESDAGDPDAPPSGTSDPAGEAGQGGEADGSKKGDREVAA